jgi:Cu/Ag efflux protein CusF
MKNHFVVAFPFRGQAKTSSREHAMKQALTVVLAAFVTLAPLAQADSARPVSKGTAVTGMPLADGEVRKVDKAAGKITIKHGPLQNLDMPAMTMVFRVKDPAWLDQIQAGDKILFLAEQVNGALTVVRYESAQ